MNRKIFNHKILQESLKKRRHVQQLPSFKLLQYFSKKLPESVAERWKSLGPKQILSESKSSNKFINKFTYIFWFDKFNSWKVKLQSFASKCAIFLALGPDTLMRAPCQWHKYSPATFPESIGEERGTFKPSNRFPVASPRLNDTLTQVTQRSSPHCFCPQRSSQSSTNSTRLCESSLKRSRWNMLKRCWKHMKGIERDVKACRESLEIQRFGELTLWNQRPKIRKLANIWKNCCA